MILPHSLARSCITVHCKPSCSWYCRETNIPIRLGQVNELTILVKGEVWDI